MRKFRVWVMTNRVGSKCETIIEVDDHADAGEIEDIASEAKDVLIMWDYEPIETTGAEKEGEQ